MSKKNLSQSITEAWKTAVETGQRLDENKQKRQQEVSKIFDSARTDVIQHVLENDHGFYRPDIDPFFSNVDGGMLQRKRLVEETEEERRKREAQAAARAEYQKLIDAGGGEKQTDMVTQGGTQNVLTRDESDSVESQLSDIRKREQEEIAKRDAQAQTGINPDSERYRGRESEAALRGDPDFDPTAPGAQGEVAASRVQDNLNKVTNPYRGGRRLPAGYAGRGTNYGGAVPVGGLAPSELSPEERERQRAEKESRVRAGSEEKLQDLDPDSRARIEAGLADDADLDTIAMAITREKNAQDRIKGLEATGYESGTDFDPITGKLTTQGREKRLDRQSDMVDRRTDRLELQKQRQKLLGPSQGWTTARGKAEAEARHARRLNLKTADQLSLRGNLEMARKRLAKDIERGRVSSGSGGSGTSTGAQLPSGPPNHKGEKGTGTDGAGNIITYVSVDDGKGGFKWEKAYNPSDPNRPPAQTGAGY